jgi:hypothetical protein
MMPHDRLKDKIKALNTKQAELINGLSRLELKMVDIATASIESDNFEFIIQTLRHLTDVHSESQNILNVAKDAANENAVLWERLKSVTNQYENKLQPDAEQAF